MIAPASRILALTQGGKSALYRRLCAGDWWRLCETMARQPDWTPRDQDAVATLPEPEDLAPATLIAWRHAQAAIAALPEPEGGYPVWSQAARWFDPPSPANRYLVTALLQLHCARLAAGLDTGWTARGGVLDQEQSRTLAKLTAATRRPERELRHWIARLVDPTPDPYRQRINALWVNDTRDGGGAAFLTLGQIPDAKDLILSDPHLAFVAEIARFLPIYLGRPGQPVPFGGRQAAREALDAWFRDLGQPWPPYLLVTAPAGLGKSALLARWVLDFWLREQDALLYLPIGPRSGLHREISIARALLTRLCALHGEPLGDIADTPPTNLFEQAQSLLGRPLPDGRRLLIILDGIDEAADWRPLVKLFPLIPPEGLRVLVAARTVLGESDRGVWLDRLGWTAEGLAQVLELSLLRPEDIRDVMRRMGAPLDQIADDEPPTCEPWCPAWHQASENHHPGRCEPIRVRVHRGRSSPSATRLRLPNDPDLTRRGRPCADRPDQPDPHPGPRRQGNPAPTPMAGRLVAPG